MNFNIKKVPVYIFEKNERTKDFSKFCFEKLGYENVNFITEGETFKDKYLSFAKIGLASEYDYFIRSDADCLPFLGINDLLNQAINENYDWLTGVYFDYIMNRFRGGTPQILSRKVLKILNENNNLMPDSKKPETDFSIAIKNMVKMGDVKVFTNLHEFEQYPSKVCNSFLNRLKRGHNYLYDSKYLDLLPNVYKVAIQTALNEIGNKKDKNNMNYSDYSRLDQGFVEIKTVDFENFYNKYNNLYKQLKAGYK